MHDILYLSPWLLNMAQNKQKEVESQSLQAFEKFIGKLDGIISGDSLYSQSVSEREIAIADVIKNGKEVIQQLKSEVRFVRHTFLLCFCCKVLFYT